MAKLFYKGLGRKETWPHVTGVNPESLTYDDVLLVPQVSPVSSRLDVDTSLDFGPYHLTIPVMTAPMDTITGEEMVRIAAKMGAIGTLPRGDLEERLLLCDKFTRENIPCVYAVSKKTGFLEAKALSEKGAKIILVDVAHGGMRDVLETAKEIKEKLNLFVIAGNIATYDQALLYQKYGIDMARVGVGPGGLCTTRLITGCGFAQLAAVLDTSSAHPFVIADGGIKYPGDVAKALCAGAKIVMIGSLLAGTLETPGSLDQNGQKTVRGQASSSYMLDRNVAINDKRAAEGVNLKVSFKGSASKVFEEISGGLRSALSYAGALNLAEFSEKAIFSIISAAVKEENHPHLQSRNQNTTKS